MEDNPNFPTDLDIRPSVGVSSLVQASSSIFTNIDGIRDRSDHRFDYAAQADAIQRYGIAGRVWEASYAMLAYVDRPPHGESGVEFDPPPFTNSHLSGPLTVLELGSGTGFVASRVAARCADDNHLLVATDLPDVCPLLEANLHEHLNVRVRPLVWGSFAHARAIACDLGLDPSSRGDASYVGAPRCPTHIICSDLVYFPALLAPLLRTLLHLSTAPFAPSAQVVVSYKVRSLVKEAPFWTAFGLWFAFTPVCVRSRGGNWTRFVPAPGDDETFVFVAHRRPESQRWVVPEDDRELLNGVGARGTSDGKADDTFETMLFMGMDVGEE